MAVKRKKKRRIKKVFLIFSILISVLLVVAATLWAVITFVPNINILTVKNITVSGDAVYSDDQVISTTGITVGNTVLKLDFNKIEALLEKQLPYIKTAKISYSLDGVLNINIISDKIVYSVKRGGEYLLLNSEYKLLEKSDNSKGVTLLYGVEIITDAEMGDIAVNTEDTSLEIFNIIEEKLVEHSISVDVIDVEDKNDVLLVYDGRCVVELGTTSELDDKIKMLAIIIKDLKPSETGRILLKHWTDGDRLSSIINEDISDYLNKY